MCVCAWYIFLFLFLSLSHSLTLSLSLSLSQTSQPPASGEHQRGAEELRSNCHHLRSEGGGGEGMRGMLREGEGGEKHDLTRVRGTGIKSCLSKSCVRGTGIKSCLSKSCVRGTGIGVLQCLLFYYCTYFISSHRNLKHYEEITDPCPWTRDFHEAITNTSNTASTSTSTNIFTSSSTAIRPLALDSRFPQGNF